VYVRREGLAAQGQIRELPFAIHGDEPRVLEFLDVMRDRCRAHLLLPSKSRTSEATLGRRYGLKHPTTARLGKRAPDQRDLSLRETRHSADNTWERA